MLYIMSKMVKIGQNSRSQQHQRDNTGSCASLPVQTGNDSACDASNWLHWLPGQKPSMTMFVLDTVQPRSLKLRIKITPLCFYAIIPVMMTLTSYQGHRNVWGGHSVFSVLNVSWLSECLVFSISFGNNLLLSLRVCSVSNVAWQRYL